MSIKARRRRVTAFLSVGSKAAGFVVLIRVLEPFLAAEAVRAKVLAVLAILAVATLIYGNLAALPQDNLKRLLAYSSIAPRGLSAHRCERHAATSPSALPVSRSPFISRPICS